MFSLVFYLGFFTPIISFFSKCFIMLLLEPRVYGNNLSTSQPRGKIHVHSTFSTPQMWPVGLHRVCCCRTSKTFVVEPQKLSFVTVIPLSNFLLSHLFFLFKKTILHKCLPLPLAVCPLGLPTNLSCCNQSASMCYTIHSAFFFNKKS